MTVLRRRGGAGTGESYLTLLDANAYRQTADRVRADRERHQATRPCPVCDEAMVDGACVEHGQPAEDGGAWLWA